MWYHDAVMWGMFSDNALWFTIPAIIGTLVFIGRMLLMSLGGDHGSGDVGTHGDVMAGGDAMHDGSSHLMGIVSVQSFFAFLMGFGWGGLGAFRGSGMEWWVSALIGAGCGLALVFLLALVMRQARGLAASGNMPLSATVGAIGEVYVGVPEKGAGAGEVRLVIGERHRMARAVSDGAAMATRTRVRVVGVNSDNTVTVAPV
jgi:hypothetical protein